MGGAQLRAVGEKAPDFELPGVNEEGHRRHRLSEYTNAGSWVLLTFYISDFHPICTEGMCALRDAEFFKFHNEMAMLGVSGDSLYAHERFAQQHHINYPLLADTSKQVGERYGAIHGEYEGMSHVHQRAVFLVDDTQTIRFVTAIDADSPDDIDLSPINEALQSFRE
jgi:peroxiredoxin